MGSELQTDVVVGATAITGTLNFVTGCTDYSPNPNKQSGFYLALNIAVTQGQPANVGFYVDYLASDGEEETFAEDRETGDHVFRVNDVTNVIKITTTVDGVDTDVLTLTMEDLLTIMPQYSEVTPLTGSTNLLGKLVSDLQTNVVVGETAITGTLKYVLGYTAVSEVPAEQEGHFLALDIGLISPPPAGVALTISYLNAANEQLAYDLDPEDETKCVFRVNNLTNKIQVHTYYSSGLVTIKKTDYSLAGLVLDPLV